jgi:hypothetical protein
MAQMTREQYRGLVAKARANAARGFFARSIGQLWVLGLGYAVMFGPLLVLGGATIWLVVLFWNAHQANRESYNQNLWMTS